MNAVLTPILVVTALSAAPEHTNRMDAAEPAVADPAVAPEAPSPEPKAASSGGLPELKSPLEYLDVIKGREWCGQGTRALADQLIARFDKLEAALPDHYKEPLRQALARRLFYVIEDAKRQVLPEYKDAHAAHRLLLLIETLVGYERLDLPDSATRQRIVKQYEDLAGDFRQYLAEKSDSLKPETSRYLLALVEENLHRFATGMFEPGFLELMTEEDLDTARALYREIVDNVVDYEAEISTEELTMDKKVFLLDTTGNARKNLAEILFRLRREVTPQEQHDHYQQWGEEVSELMGQMGQTLLAAQQKETQAIKDRAAERYERAKRELAPDSPQSKAKREAERAAFLEKWGPQGGRAPKREKVKPPPRPTPLEPANLAPKTFPWSGMILNSVIILCVIAFIVWRVRR